MRKITIVGCGQLGSRHLQAIAKIEGSLRIQIVEPNMSNQQIGLKRLSEALPENHNVKAEWVRNLDDLDQDSDLTIISTGATKRSEIITNLVEKGHQRFLIEKMVCQSTEEYEHILTLFQKHHVKGWVDCTRRYFPFYKRIIPLFENKNTFFFNVTAGNNGLGCNVIHLLDLFGWLTGSTKDIKLNGDYLMPYILPNKRGDDLVEFAGTIIASTPDGSFASVSFHPDNDAPVLINMTSDNYRIAVNESKEKAYFARNDNDWHWEEFEFQTLYTSNLTTKIALSIFEQDACNLPTIEESFWLHKELFRIFNQHIRHVTGKSVSLCPIT